MNPLNSNKDLEGDSFRHSSTLVYKTTSSYQPIYVMDQNQFEGKQGKFRVLQFTSDAIQGIINLEQPDLLVLSYIRNTVDLIDHYASGFKTGFIIGHGIGTLSSYYSDKNLVTAEIDPLVVAVSKKYFGHTGRNVKVGDGRVLLKKQEAKSLDIIFLDAYNSSKIPFHLTTKEFFSLANDKLTDKGILIVNYVGKVRNDKSLDTLYETISAVYPCVKLFATYPKKSWQQNIFFVASRHILEDYTPKEATPIRIMDK